MSENNSEINVQGTHAPKGETYKVKIDNQVKTVSQKCMTGTEILALVDKTPNKYTLDLLLRGNKTEEIAPNQTVCFDEPGIERFVTTPKSQKQGSNGPYKVKVNNNTYTVDQKCMTGAEILALDGKTPQGYTLDMLLKGNKNEEIDPNQTVCFDDPGIERFSTMPKSQPQGGVLLEEFTLPEEDIEYLNGTGNDWRTIRDGSVGWLIIHNYELPDGYNHKKVDVAILITPGYPQSPLDMAYFKPHLSRTDNRPIAKLTPQVIQGEPWQRWSRHRRPEDRWNPEIDSIVTHMSCVRNFLRQEVN